MSVLGFGVGILHSTSSASPPPPPPPQFNLEETNLANGIVPSLSLFRPSLLPRREEWQHGAKGCGGVSVSQSRGLSECPDIPYFGAGVPSLRQTF